MLGGQAGPAAREGAGGMYGVDYWCSPSIRSEELVLYYSIGGMRVRCQDVPANFRVKFT